MTAALDCRVCGEPPRAHHRDTGACPTPAGAPAPWSRHAYTAPEDRREHILPAEHYAEVELYPDGDLWPVRFICSGTDADECHQWCAEGCEESCTGSPIRLWSPESPESPDDPLVAQAPVLGHRWTPAAYTSGGCRIVDWLDACGDADTYAGDDEPWGPHAAREGRHLIEVEWTGDDYVWSYPDVEPATPGRPL